jgi:hypothetical protein
MSMTKAVMATVAACLAMAPSAWAQATTFHETERIPFDIEAFSECTGEDIDVEGTLLVNSQITVDDAGGAHFHLTLAVADVSGTTASGEMIRFIFTDVFQDNFTSGGTVTFTSNLYQQGVVQGPRNNFFLDFTFHFTFTASGQDTVVGNVRFGCRNG